MADLESKTSARKRMKKIENEGQHFTEVEFFYIQYNFLYLGST